MPTAPFRLIHLELTACSVVLGAMLAATGQPATSGCDDVVVRHTALQGASPEQLPPVVIDPAEMFNRVVARYRSLTTYEDSVIVEQVTARSGELSTREETHITCEINDGGRAAVNTPGEQVREAVGFDLFLDANPALRDLARKYELWMAPHLALRELEQPLAEFRDGVEEGFTPVSAETVTVDDTEFVRVDLHAGDGLSEDYRAKFELFIHPETLLIQRVRGVQLMPDGSNLLTDYNITPHRALTSEGEEISQPASIGT